MKWLALILFPLLLTACDSMLTFLAGEGWQPQGSAFKEVNWNGDMADATSFTTIVARNEGEWQNMWQRVGQEPPAALPSGKMAVAVLAGQRPLAGYKVEIVSANKEMQLGRAERFIVKYLVRPPVAGKPAQKQLNSPWAIRLADTSEVVPYFTEIKVRDKSKSAPK